MKASTSSMVFIRDSDRRSVLRRKWSGTPMELVERESGLTGRLLRPLSAKFFPPTLAERDDIVPRWKLLAIQGRSRKPQLELARELALGDYPCPAGGCLLTDPQFAHRVREMLDHGRAGPASGRSLLRAR